VDPGHQPLILKLLQILSDRHSRDVEQAAERDHTDAIVRIKLSQDLIVALGDSHGASTVARKDGQGRNESE